MHILHLARALVLIALPFGLGLVNFEAPLADSSSGVSSWITPNESAASVRVMGTPTLSLVAPSIPQPTTAPVSVLVTVAGISDLGAFEFDLEFDPARVQLTDLVIDPSMGKTVNCSPDVDRCAIELGPVGEANLASVGAFTYGAGAGFSGDGTIGVLTFQPTGIPGEVTLHIVDAILTDPQANPLSVLTQDARLTLVAGHPVFLPLLSNQ